MPTEVGGYFTPIYWFLGKTPNSKIVNESGFHASLLLSKWHQLLTCQRTRNSRSITPDIPVGETKNGQAQLTFALLVRFHQTQECQLKALMARRQFKF